MKFRYPNFSLIYESTFAGCLAIVLYRGKLATRTDWFLENRPFVNIAAAGLQHGSDGSGQDLLDDISMHIRQSEIASGVSERHPLVVVTHQLQDRGMQIMDRYWILHGLETKLIGRSIDHPPLDPSTGHPQ
jgi:hypothetical protein